ncbi:hypothetical protein CEXT_320611 [Caerostris extrusa]|uniref:Uncharacterized protein n=1 Tax=Caerostris extrusa TaxID=172846 RepID=A0AAV4WKN0_CAEEX|nr:hypothetical protein CEXT_320611 [Caerostris extrusa]
MARIIRTLKPAISIPPHTPSNHPRRSINVSTPPTWTRSHFSVTHPRSQFINIFSPSLSPSLSLREKERGREISGVCVHTPERKLGKTLQNN